MNGGKKSLDYKITLSRDPCFKAGQTVMHALDYQIGMIIGRESSCNQDDDWIKMNDIDALPRGRDQPFYMILPDSRSEGEKTIRYVAEDLLLKADMEHLFENPLLDLFLKKDEKKPASLIDSRTTEDGAQIHSSLTDRAPEEDKNRGCWLVHDIRLWD
jgi:hemimethylated DNA binding protein